MDPLSVVGSVAGVAAMGTQLSRTIYDLTSIFCEAEKEMSTLANEIWLLAMVLDELEGVLRRDSRVYRRHMVKVVNEILSTCESVFQSISKYVSVHPRGTKPSRRFQRKVRWCFQRHRVKPIQAGLGSMTSTLNVLLHIVQLARVAEAAESLVPSFGIVCTQSDVRKERHVLVGVLLENRRSILSLKQIEEKRDSRPKHPKIIDDEREIEGVDSNVALNHGAPNNERELDLARTTDNGTSNSPGDWGEGSSAITSTTTGLFSKAEKDSATETTDVSNWSFGGKQKVQMPNATGCDFIKTSPCDEGSGSDQTEGANARGDDFWDDLITTNTPKQRQMERKNGLLDRVSVMPNPTVIDPIRGNLETEADDLWSAWSVISCEDKPGKEKKKEKKEKQKEVKKNNWRPCDATLDLSVPAKSACHFANVVNVVEISEACSINSKSSSGINQFNGADDLPSPSGSHRNSLLQCPASERQSVPPKISPVTNSVEQRQSGDYVAENPSRPQVKAKGFSKSQGSPPGTDIVTPTAQWFLSVIPHESSISALIVEPQSDEANHLRARAEQTVKTLLFHWTNLEPDVIFGQHSTEGFYPTEKFYSNLHGPARDEECPNQPYQMSYTPHADPTYTPQPWHPPLLFAAPAATNEKQTDSEELARLKKLILDEKAEQDVSAAAKSAAAPPTAPIAPIPGVQSLEDTMQNKIANTEAVDSTRKPGELNALWNAEPPRLQPVIMRDWLGRKFIFPVDMCQAWEGLHNLIQEAFGHVLEHRPMVEKGEYIVSHVTGDVILPSTWKFSVQPGLEININIWNPFDADRDVSSGKVIEHLSRDIKADTRIVTLPEAPNMPAPESSVTLRLRTENESSIDDVADDETKRSFLDEISHIEQSDPRYLFIQNTLREQKKAKVEVEMKLERNRRFFQLKQQLMDQGAAIQARQDAADHTEQDIKLAWLEKQVRDQKAELDRLPPFLAPLPVSSAGDSSSKTAGKPQRRPSFGARLLSRIPTRIVRSKSSI